MVAVGGMDVKVGSGIEVFMSNGGDVGSDVAGEPQAARAKNATIKTRNLMYFIETPLCCIDFVYPFLCLEGACQRLALPDRWADVDSAWEQKTRSQSLSSSREAYDH
jgi:hypothetical protein